MRNFQRPEVVPIWIEVKDWNGNYVDPTSIYLTVKHKDGLIVVNNEAVTKSDVGEYVYYWTSLIDSPDGWYTIIATITDGTGEGAKVTIELGGFYLQ